MAFSGQYQRTLAIKTPAEATPFYGENPNSVRTPVSSLSLL
jgi:hypothetical protein